MMDLTTLDEFKSNLEDYNSTVPLLCNNNKSLISAFTDTCIEQEQELISQLKDNTICPDLELIMKPIQDAYDEIVSLNQNGSSSKLN